MEVRDGQWEEADTQGVEGCTTAVGGGSGAATTDALTGPA
jgi:hypothetical protein